MPSAYIDVRASGVGVAVAGFGATGTTSVCTGEPPSIDHVTVVAVFAGSSSVAFSVTGAPAGLVAGAIVGAGQANIGGGVNRKMTPEPRLSAVAGPNSV